MADAADAACACFCCSVRADEISSSTGVYRRSGLAPTDVEFSETIVSDQLCETLPRL